MKNSYKWLVLALLGSAFFFHQADRALFGLLTIPIQDELGLTKGQIGWINTVLSWTLAGMALVAGPIGDRLSKKGLITGSLIGWSLMTVVMGFVGDWRIGAVFIPAFFVVMFFRSIATGVGESFFGPCYPAFIAAYHKRTRSLALSIMQGSLYVGLMTCGILSDWALGVLGSWRQVFIAFGVAGFLLGVSFIWLLKDPEGGASRSQPKVRTKDSFFSGLVYFTKTPSAWCAMAGFVAIVFVNNAYLFWAPTFMAEKFGVAVGKAGVQTMLWHHLFAFAAILAGGVVTDRFVKKRPRFRLGFQIVSLLCGAPVLVWLGFAPNWTSFLAAGALYGVFRGFFEVNTHASLFDVIPSEHRSTATGIFMVFAFFFGGLSGVIMGALSEKCGIRGFEIGFALTGAVYAFAAVLMSLSFFFTFRRDRIAERD